MARFVHQLLHQMEVLRLVSRHFVLKIAFIYDSVPEIMEKIRNAKCRACKIPWEKLKETNPIAYLLCENF